MADNTESKSSIPLPPKLDLRRGGAPKPSPAPQAVPAPAPQAAPAVAVAPLKSQDATPTVRITSAPSLAGSPSTTVKIVPGPSLSIAPAPTPTVVVRSQPAPTIEIKRPAPMSSPASGAGVKPLTVTAAPPPPEKKPAGKSETSRIPLELATPAAGTAGVEMKTIRVKPVAISPSPAARPLGAMPTSPAPTIVAPAPAAPAAAPKPVEEKRKTSRISLESVMAIEDKGAPKTIRLKRPGEGTAKAAPTIDTIRAEAPPAAKAGMGQTARLDDEPAATEEEGPTPTRRKTIKVKRPSDKPGIRIAAGGGDAAGGAKPAADGEAVALPKKATGFDWTAMIVAIFVIILTFVVMFMLASQAWGPNPSLTQLSSWTDGPDFGWTGKIPRAQ